MFSFFDKLRKEDKRKQESFTFFTAFAITFFIFGIWLFSLIYDFSDKSVENTASPITVFTNQIKNIFTAKEVYDAED